MNTRHAISGLALLLAAGGAWAQPGPHEHGGKGMMQQDRMHQHMDEMRGMMQQMNRESEFKPRYELMFKHMDALSKMMADMGEMPDTRGMTMEQRQDMLEQRLRLMQGVMEQMAGHMQMMHGMGRSVDKPAPAPGPAQ